MFSEILYNKPNNDNKIQIEYFTDNHQLYGNGNNGDYNLGIGNNKRQYSPVLIESLTNVIGVGCGYKFSIAIKSTFPIDILI